MKPTTRCINIDWLEVYVHEPNDQVTRDAEYFRSLGFDVTERAYGTRQYNQMFTLNDTMGEGWIEVRRDPKGLKTESGFSVLDEGSAHIRFCNRTCYASNSAQIMIDFLWQHKYILSRISRLDICLDFEKFDSKDDPQKFLDRYLKGVYSKVNQGNISAHGKDQWDGRFWNSLSWGAEKSMITTKFYNKTMELKQKRDKPYIRQAWAAAGLVDDMITLQRRKQDGTIYNPDIWRLEFSIRSSVKRWYVIEDVHGAKRKLRSIHHVLDDYITDRQLLEHFAGLVQHYFFFRKFIPGQRKDRCPEKKLFNFQEIDRRYEVEHLATSKPVESTLISLKNRLEYYIQLHPCGKSHDAAVSLLSLIREEVLARQARDPESRREIILLQQLISRRLSGTNQRTLNEDIHFVEALMDFEGELFD